MNKEKLTPRTSEAESSLENLRGRLKKIYDLERSRTIGYRALTKDNFVDPLTGKKYTEYGIHEKSRHHLGGVPEFEDFLKEETGILTTGPSKEEIRRYSDLYQRVYQRYQKMGAELANLKEDREADNAWYALLHELQASKIYPYPSWEQLDDAMVRDAVEQGATRHAKETRHDKLFHRYLEVAPAAREALKGIKAKALLEAQESAAKERGLNSVVDMWGDALLEMAKLRKEAGEEEFQRITDRDHELREGTPKLETQG